MSYHTFLFSPYVSGFTCLVPDTCEEDLRLVVRELGRFAGELELTLRQKVGEEKTVSLEILGVGDFHSGCWLFALFDEDLHSSLELVVLRLDEVETSFEITYISHRDLGDLVFFRWGGSSLMTVSLASEGSGTWEVGGILARSAAGSRGVS